MGFTTPCFIRKDNKFIREKLKELGYRLIDNDNQRDGLVADHGNMYSIFECNLIDSTYNCGTNEELFLAIAALRDDTDKYQWFTDGDLWILCPEIKFSTYWVYNDIDVNTDTIHKATVNELIEHFKIKEEQ